MRAPVALVVDDDRGVRRALSIGLAEAGLVLREASNGEQALEEIARGLPDIVVLDVAMPGMSGVEVVTRIRRSGRTLPVCMLSAKDEVDDRVAGSQPVPMIMWSNTSRSPNWPPDYTRWFVCIGLVITDQCCSGILLLKRRAVSPAAAVATSS
jgi:CheY-like chemotaxis protein